MTRRISLTQNRVFLWCRICVSACVTLVVPTRVWLWRKVAFGGKPVWDERNKIIAQAIPAGTSVLDVGCGAQTLRQYLREGCKYQPSDVIKSTPDVILCDLNAGIYPETREHFDYVVCSGVLEYVRKPKEFLTKIPKLGRTVILSYCPLAEGGSKLKRLGNPWGWINHFRQQELEELFETTDLQASLLHVDKQYMIYSLRSRNGAEAKP
jgi:hypothetical protein